MFWAIYFAGLFLWFMGYLPISGWWFILIFFILPFAIVLIVLMTGAGVFTLGAGFFGLSKLIEKYQNRNKTEVEKRFRGRK